MDDVTRDPRSKLRHIDACLSGPVDYRKSTGLETWDFVNDPLPELSLSTIDTSAVLAGKRLAAPLMIAPMTGGTPRSLELNQRLARTAQAFGLGFGVGSQRIAIENPELEPWFQVRDAAPGIPLFANLGAAQLARGYGPDEARRAVRMIGADALFVHLNPMQEALQHDDCDFRQVERPASLASIAPAQAARRGRRSKPTARPRRSSASVRYDSASGASRPSSRS